MAKVIKESATIKVDEETLTRLAALGKLFGVRSIDRTLAAVVERFHAVHLEGAGKLPDGWALRDDLTLQDLEAYYTAYDEEKPVSAWHERGRTIRAACVAGWFSAPVGLTTEQIGKLRPAQVPPLKAAIDELYLKVTTADPN